jgi:hypothetical protein
VNYERMSTSALLSAAEALTISLHPQDRSTVVDADLADIVAELESRGYLGTWDRWITSGHWDAIQGPLQGRH